MTNKIYDDYDFLYREHIVKRKSLSEIARDCGVSGDTIRRKMIKYNINYWTSQYKPSLSQEQKDLIKEMYLTQKMSANQIGTKIGCTHKTVIRNLQSMHIPIRDISESQFLSAGKQINKLYNDAEWLYQMYWVEGKTTTEIGAELGVCASTVLRHLKKLHIDTKSVSQAKIGQLVGEKHPNWHGGITPLSKLLRQYFRIYQMPVIVKRDNYTCQLCGATHTVLNVHHIKSFSDIIREIVAEHPEYDVNTLQGKEKLYEIIINDERFLDESNLITFCKDCHYYEIHEYKRNKDN